MTGQRKLSIDTLAVHAGQEIDPTTGARAVPLYQEGDRCGSDRRHYLRSRSGDSRQPEMKV